MDQSLVTIDKAQTGDASVDDYFQTATSNKSYLEWGKTFGDDVLATAILDRLLHLRRFLSHGREEEGRGISSAFCNGIDRVRNFSLEFLGIFSPVMTRIIKPSLNG